MFFRDVAWETIALVEQEQRRHESELTKASADLPTARRAADLSFAHPQLSGGLVTSMALAGIEPMSQEANDIDTWVAQYEARVRQPDEDRSVFDAGYTVLKAGVRGLFTAGSSIYDEVVKGGTSFATAVARGEGSAGDLLLMGDAGRRSFGFSSGAVALASLAQGRPVNLGQGFMPGGDFAQETIDRLRQGMTMEEAVRNPAQLEIGLPAFDWGEARRESTGVKVGVGDAAVPVTPGRLIASGLVEPGTQPFHYMSGAIDFGANIFADPAAGLGKAAGLAKTSNARLIANSVIDGTGARPGVLSRGVDEWLQSAHGTAVANHVAKERNYLNIHRMLRNQKGRPAADLIKALTDETDPEKVRELLRAGAKTGHITNVVGRQGLAQRGVQGLSDAFGTNPRMVGGVNGWRGLVTDRVRWNWWDRMTAEVGSGTLSVIDGPDEAVRTLGDWMKVAEFDEERIGHWMGRMAELQPGETEGAFDVVVGVVKEFGDDLERAGFARPAVDKLTEVFNTSDDLRQYWISQAGNPELFPGGRWTTNAAGDIVATPSAQLMSEFLARSIPLPEIRKVRSVLRRKKWAERIPGTVDDHILKRMDDFDKFGNGTLTNLMDAYMSKAWKPLTLLRLAWPVRVVGEEQLRMLAAGLDSGIDHPISTIAQAIARAKGQSDEFTDLTGDVLREATEFRDAMSHGGDTLLHHQSAPYDITAWTKTEKGSARYLPGWAIQFNHLADDPLASKLAREIVDAPDGDQLGAVARIKQQFWDGELEEHRLRLSRDGRSWKMFQQKWAADGYVDSVLARMVQNTGGRYVAHDWLRGEWRDDFGKILSMDEIVERGLQTPQRGQAMIGYASQASAPVMRDFLEQTRTFGDASFMARIDQLDGGDPGEASAFIEEFEKLFENFRQVTGRNLDDLVDDQGTGDVLELIRNEVDGLLEGNPYSRNVIEQATGNMFVAIENARHEMITELAPSLGRAQMTARDLIEAIDQRGAEDIFGGYRDFGTTAGRESAEALTGRPGLQPGEAARAFEGRNTALHSFDRHPVDPGDPTNGVWSLPERRSAVGSSSAGHTFDEIKVANDGHVTGILIAEYDASGKLIDIPEMRVAMNENGKAAFPRDSMALFEEAMNKIEDGREVYDMLFGGVPIREWLASSGLEGIDESLSIREALEIVREQYGKSWAQRGTGQLGDIPSIALTEDGSKVAERVFGIARQSARRSGKANQLDPYTWSQDRMMYEITEWGNNDLLRAIADGELDGTSIASRRLSDLQPNPKKKAINEVARKLENYIDNGPQFTAVAKEREVGKFDDLDKVTNALFHYLGSAPTNLLSRSPAFKQFYMRRVAELYPMLDDAGQTAALRWANDNEIATIGDALKAQFKGDTPTEVAFNRRAKDFVKGRFDGVSGDMTFNDADEIAKAFALEETKALLYDQSKRSNFFDINRNIFPFGEAWAEIIKTWSRIVSEDPSVLFRGQQAIEGARQAGIFYPDPSTGEEKFSFPFQGISDWMLGFDEESDQALEASPNFEGRVTGLNIAGSLVPGVGPMVQLGVAKGFGEMINHPDLRLMRDLVFPFGQPDEQEGLGDVLLPSWVSKALVAIGKPTGDDQRLFANTVTDVMRAMQMNGEIDLNTPEGFAEAEEIAISRAKRIYMIRSASQFIGPTGAGVTWEVEADETGFLWTYQTLSTAYFEELEEQGGDHDAAMDSFIKLFGLDPFDWHDRAYGRESLAGIVRGKSRQVIPRSVTEEGLDFESTNSELFDSYPLTAYFAEPDDPDGEFNYNAYLGQLNDKTRVALSPEEWRRERNLLLGNMAYDKARQGAIQAGTVNDPATVAWLRNLRFQLMEKYDGYGYGSIGETARSGDEIRDEFETWADDPFLSQTDAGQGLTLYLDIRRRAIDAGITQGFMQTEGGLSTAKNAEHLRNYLFQMAQSIAMQHPDFAVIFERYYAREVENPLAERPAEFARVTLFGEDEDV